MPAWIDQPVASRMSRCGACALAAIAGLALATCGFAKDLLGGAEEPLSTNLEDAVQDVIIGDDLEATRVMPLADARRVGDGVFRLAPGRYHAELPSFCLHPGKRAGGKGAAYLPAPFKGPRAKLVRAIINRWTARAGDVPQANVQSLLWTLLSRGKIRDASNSIREAAKALMTDVEITLVDNDALSVLAQDELANLRSTVPEEVYRVLEAQNAIRGRLADPNTSFEELEALAVPPAEDPGPPTGAWVRMPQGYFVRFVPDSYKRLQLDVLVPSPPVSGLRGLGGLLAFPAANPTIDVEVGGVAVPTGSAQRLGYGAPAPPPGGGDAGTGGVEGDGGPDGETPSSDPDEPGDPSTAPEAPPSAGGEGGAEPSTGGGGGAAIPPLKPGQCARPKPSAYLEDPCMDRERARRERTDYWVSEERCPLSHRAFMIRLLLNDSKLNAAGIRMAVTIGVSEGKVAGKRVRLVTTNRPEALVALHDLAKRGKLAPDEVVWPAVGQTLAVNSDAKKTSAEGTPSPFQHAEDAARDYFRDRIKSRRADTVCLGTDPQACPACTAEYGKLKWLVHERINWKLESAPDP